MKSKTEYDTSLSIVLLLSIIYFFTKNPLFIYIGFAIGVIALLSSKANYFLYYVWKKLLAIIGTINAHVILSLVFFAVLFPISTIYKLFNKDPLNLKEEDSAFLNIDKVYSSKDIENPW